MSKTSLFSRTALHCSLVCIFLLTSGVATNAATTKASAKKTISAKSGAQKPAPKASTAKTAYASILKNDVTLYSGPDAKKEALWKVFKGYPMQVLSRQGKWAQVVDVDGDKGWIATDLLTKEKTVIVKANAAKMRAGAGKDYEITADVKHGVVFKPLETKDEWVKVKHADGTTGWILGKMLWP